MKSRLVIIGAGGHARVIISLARLAGKWDIAGVLDRTCPTIAETLSDIPVIGSFDDAAALFNSGIHYAALAVGDNDERAALFVRFSAIGYRFPILCHPSALIATDALLGEGTVVCAGAILTTQSQVGRAVIINTGAIIDHETTIGDYVHIAPGCRVAGRVRIDAAVMLGIGSCVRDKIVIGSRAIIGAGSVVVHDIPSAVVAYGNPARVARSRLP